jgi:hypothetical protein
MAGKLISLPLRASLRSAQIVTRAVGGVAGRALAIPGHAIQVASSGRSNRVERDADAQRDVAPRSASPTRTPAPRTVRAEPGAGATVTVLEPWTGYGRMTARDVIDRVRSASVAELAALRLYEARHRARRTVLAAADRQLKLAAGGRPA